MRYKTRSMAEAAALLADETIETDFEGLEPTERDNIFKFVVVVKAEPEQLNKWVIDYINNATNVRPKKYDEQLNMLRDRLSYAKN